MLENKKITAKEWAMIRMFLPSVLESVEEAFEDMTLEDIDKWISEESDEENFEQFNRILALIVASLNKETLLKISYLIDKSKPIFKRVIDETATAFQSKGEGDIK